MVKRIRKTTPSAVKKRAAPAVVKKKTAPAAAASKRRVMANNSYDFATKTLREMECSPLLKAAFHFGLALAFERHCRPGGTLITPETFTTKLFESLNRTIGRIDLIRDWEGHARTRKDLRQRAMKAFAAVQAKVGS